MKTNSTVGVIILFLASLWLAGCSLLNPSLDLRTLTEMGQLQALFNQAKGKPRLVLLVSPT